MTIEPMTIEPMTIGIITGLEAEAKCLPGHHRYFCAASDPFKARLGTGQLIDEGVQGLVSFGLAGGLDPACRVGELLLPSRVVLPSGRPIATDAIWRERLDRVIRKGMERGPADAAIYGSETMIGTSAAKKALFRTTGAAAIDMESHVVAKAAMAAGLPFIVIRAIVDVVEATIPESAAAGLDEAGRIDPFAAAVALIRHPGDIPATIRLGLASRKALKELRRVATLAPGLAFG